MPYILEHTIAEGKTKKIIKIKGREEIVVLEAKSDITAGDGEKHEVIVGKDVLATRTTCSVFKLLKDADLPVAFEEQISPNQFVAPFCTMLPYEVVGRRESHGSDQHRNPHLPLGTIYPKLKVEFFAKTNNKMWWGWPMRMDDPLLLFTETDVQFFLPHWTKEEKKTALETGHKGFLVGQKPFLSLSKETFFRPHDEAELLPEMRKLLIRVFLVLEKAWQLQGRRLVDIKIEFGVGLDGTLYIADVIDNDSWRVLQDGVYICKQSFRDDGDMNKVTQNYQLVADLTEQFGIPEQRIIIWRGSSKDSFGVFTEDQNTIFGQFGERRLGLQATVHHTRSFHKEPVLGIMELHRLIQEVPDTVIIDYIGMSNGAGPIISANCTVPVFNVPAGTDQEREKNVWSSLELPSSVPAATIMNPVNAVLAALQVLAARNPCLYAILRAEQEERFTNVTLC